MIDHLFQCCVDVSGAKMNYSIAELNWEAVLSSVKSEHSLDGTDNSSTSAGVPRVKGLPGVAKRDPDSKVKLKQPITTTKTEFGGSGCSSGLNHLLSKHKTQVSIPTL